MNFLKPGSILLSIALILALSSSCDKTDTSSLESNQLQGKWSLVKVTGGIHGQGYTPDFDLLEFSGDRYRLAKGSNTLSSGTYQYDPEVEFGLTLTPDSAQPSTAGFEQDKKAVVFDGKDKMFIADPCCDRFEYQFSKNDVK